MEITAKQQRNMYAIFIGLFAINLGVTMWNTYQDHQLRKLQKEELKNKINGN